MIAFILAFSFYAHAASFQQIASELTPQEKYDFINLDCKGKKFELKDFSHCLLDKYKETLYYAANPKRKECTLPNYGFSANFKTSIVNSETKTIPVLDTLIKEPKERILCRKNPTEAEIDQFI